MSRRHPLRARVERGVVQRPTKAGPGTPATHRSFDGIKHAWPPRLCRAAREAVWTPPNGADMVRLPPPAPDSARRPTRPQAVHEPRVVLGFPVRSPQPPRWAGQRERPRPCRAGPGSRLDAPPVRRCPAPGDAPTGMRSAPYGVHRLRQAGARLGGEGRAKRRAHERPPSWLCPRRRDEGEARKGSGSLAACTPSSGTGRGRCTTARPGLRSTPHGTPGTPRSRRRLRPGRRRRPPLPSPSAKPPARRPTGRKRPAAPSPAPDSARRPTERQAPHEAGDVSGPAAGRVRPLPSPPAAPPARRPTGRTRSGRTIARPGLRSTPHEAPGRPRNPYRFRVSGPASASLRCAGRRRRPPLPSPPAAPPARRPTGRTRSGRHRTTPEPERRPTRPQAAHETRIGLGLPVRIVTAGAGPASFRATTTLTVCLCSLYRFSLSPSLVFLPLPPSALRSPGPAAATAGLPPASLLLADCCSPSVHRVPVACALVLPSSP